MSETKIKVTGMSCHGCVASVQSGLLNVEGVKSAVVDLENNLATVEHDDVPDESLIEAIQDRGFEASIDD